MIVQIKLSIPDDKYDDAEYHIGQLVKMSRMYPLGYIKKKFVGMQGTTAASRERQRTNGKSQKISELFV